MHAPLEPNAPTHPQPPTQDDGPDWKRIALRVAAALAVFAYVGQFLASDELIDEGERAPAFQATLDGKRLDTTHGPGRPLVLTFWASWCGPCRQEAPILSALHDRGVLVAGVNLEDKPRAEVVHAAHSIGIRFPVIAQRPDLVSLFRVQAVPTTYVLAEDGTIVLAQSGVLSRSALEEALADARASEN